MAIIYSASVPQNEAFYGKFIHPIKAVIEDESNAWEKKKTFLTEVYNIEKSDRYAETTTSETSFDTFMAHGEGQGAENDTVQRGFDKTIEHIEFGKEFTITKKMADDSKVGIAPSMKRGARKFTSSYYRTQIKLGAHALINATQSSIIVNNAKLDLTTGDGMPLFSSQHKFVKEKYRTKSQSNYFYGGFTTSQDKFEEALMTLANKGRNFKSEEGESLDTVMDTILIPANRPVLEGMVRKVIYSQYATGTNNNDINTQYGSWKYLVVPEWETNDDRFMLMSSSVNKENGCNMFYNRVNLDIRSSIDEHTRNLIWNAYCRFGLGFTDWKHMLLAVNSASTVAGATQL